jgi:hypothetical protein
VYGNVTITEEDIAYAEGIYLPPWYNPEDIDEYLDRVSMDANVNYDAVRALVELRHGVATPISIVFEWDQPFFPVKISSSNPGDTEIDVYVFADSPMKDEMLTLSVISMLAPDQYNHDLFDFDTDSCYITKLRYFGDLDEDDVDSLFVSTAFQPELQPNYISLGDRIIRLLRPSNIFLFFFFLYVPLIPILCIGVPFLISNYLGLKSVRIRKKPFHYTELYIVFAGAMMVVGLFLEFNQVFVSNEVWSLPLVWFLVSLILVSVLSGLYVAHENSLKRVWVSIMIILLFYALIML